MREFMNFRKRSWLLTGDKKQDVANLKYLINSAGLSQQEIADNLGVSIQTVNQVVNRHINSKSVLNYLERVAKQIEFKL